MNREETKRSRTLLGSIDVMLTAHDHWVESDQQPLSAQFVEAVNDLVVVWASGSIPGPVRKLAREVEKLTEAWEAHQERAAITSDAMPERGFWRAVSAVRKGREVAAERRFNRPEPIARLIDQNVPRHQICLIWGFMLEDGQTPDYEKLEQEVAKPGTHTGENWVNPEQAAHEKELREQAEAVARVEERRSDILQRLRESPATETAVEEEEAEGTEPEALPVSLLVGHGIAANDVGDLQAWGLETVADLRAYLAEHGGFTAVKGVGDKGDERIKAALEVLAVQTG